MKLIICEFGQETNTFSPDRIGFEKLAPFGWCTAETMLEVFTGTSTYLGGAIKAASEHGVQVIPIDSVRSAGGPLMTEECLEYCLSHICAELKEKMEGASGMFLAMHGGGRTEAVEDLEAYTLKRVREVVGDMPIMSSLDLHCNISEEKVARSDGLFIIKEYPHIDCMQAGYLATDTLIRKLKGEMNPVMSMVQIPMMVANSNTSTYAQPMKGIKEYLAQYQKEHGLIDVSFGHGFSANDQPFTGASIIVTAEHKADKEALELAKYIWDKRFELNPKPLSASEAFEQALKGVKDGYAVINESTDNPGSGCPGDGTHLLRELVRRNLKGTVFMFMLDPAVVEQAHKAGVGAFIDIDLGGKTAEICGEPLHLEKVEVLNLSNGRFRYRTPMRYLMDDGLGRAVRLRHENVEIVVVSERMQALDDRALLMTGADIEDYQIVCLKSANHFRGFFQERADIIVTAETPGLRPSDLKLNPYQQVRRPIYPLDEDMTWEI